MTSRLGDFTMNGRRLALLTALAVVIGSASALIAVFLLDLIGFITHLAYFGTLDHSLVAPDPRVRGAWSVGIPVLGGIIVGFLARYGSDKIRGHGIPEAIQSILERESRMEARVAVIKPLASAIAIGTGGPFGAEGPIIMTGGALGSLFAQFFHITASERRTLLVAGASAGMSAVFGSPIAGAFIAVELLLFEWRPRSFIPVALASLIADAIRIVLIGGDAVFPGIVPQIAFGGSVLFGTIMLGLLIGLCSVALTRMVYAAEDAYRRLPFHWMWYPALGGLIVGIGGMVEPRALGVGYDTIRALVNGGFPAGALPSLLLVKTLIWVGALSSGTSGGVLAPLLMIGACIGSLASTLLPGHDAAFWATVGMASMLGGTMRAPFTATFFALETTHAWEDAPALFSACVIASAVTILMTRRSILTEKAARKGTHVAREYGVHPLEGVGVREAMIPRERVATVFAEESIASCLEELGRSGMTRRHIAYPVVDMRGRIVGILEYAELIACAVHGRDRRVTDIMLSPLFVHGDRRLRSAAERMATAGRHALVVFDDSKRWVGFLAQGDVLRAWRRGIHHDRRRVRVWRFPEAIRNRPAVTPESPLQQGR